MDSKTVEFPGPGSPPGAARTRPDIPIRRGAPADPAQPPEPPEPPETGQDGPEPEPEPSGEGRRRRRRRWPRIVIRTVVAVVVLAVLVPLVTAGRVWYQARQDEHPASDAIIVLGAAQYNGRPSPTLQWRLQHALNLYRDGVAPKIVTVGGNQPGDNFTEAGAGRTWLIERGGVPAADVVAVPVGVDTLQSIRAVGDAYRRHGWSSGVIVTDPWHTLRSKRMAADAGIDASGSPTRSGPSVLTRKTQMSYIVRETGAYLYYVLLGKSVDTPAESR